MSNYPHPSYSTFSSHDQPPPSYDQAIREKHLRLPLLSSSTSTSSPLLAASSRVHSPLSDSCRRLCLSYTCISFQLIMNLILGAINGLLIIYDIYSISNHGWSSLIIEPWYIILDVIVVTAIVMEVVARCVAEDACQLSTYLSKRVNQFDFAVAIMSVAALALYLFEYNFNSFEPSEMWNTSEASVLMIRIIRDIVRCVRLVYFLNAFYQSMIDFRHIDSHRHSDRLISPHPHHSHIQRHDSNGHTSPSRPHPYPYPTKPDDMETKRIDPDHITAWTTAAESVISLADTVRSNTETDVTPVRVNVDPAHVPTTSTSSALSPSSHVPTTSNGITYTPQYPFTIRGTSLTDSDVDSNTWSPGGHISAINSPMRMQYDVEEERDDGDNGGEDEEDDMDFDD